MISFSKKTILIIALAIFAIILAVFFTLFLLNYLAKQKEAKVQAKINNDIALVQNLIVNKNFAQLNPEVLKSQGLAQEALDLAQLALSAEEQRLADQAQLIEANKFENKVGSLVLDYADSFFRLGGTMSYGQVAAILVSFDPNIVESLQQLTTRQDSKIRYNAYFSLSVLANAYPDKREQIFNILKTSLNDPLINIRAESATTLLSFGEKSALPIFIDSLDSKYQEVVMFTEPTLSLPSYAYLLLEKFTDQTLPADKAAWQNWWDSNSDKISWDQQENKFKTKQ